MDATPEEIVPLLMPAIPTLRRSLRSGIGYADELQPDRDSRNPWFWSDCARFKALGVMQTAATDADDWALARRVPCYGIHVGFDTLHIARVVRSLAGTTPHAGRNPTSRDAWTNRQLALNLATRNTLPPLTLIVDWHEDDGGEPILHVGLPVSTGRMGTAPKLRWRVELPDDNADLAHLMFPASPENHGELITLNVDKADEEHLGQSL